MASQFVESKIRSGQVTVFVKAGCPYCRSAMEILKSYSFMPGGLQVVDIAQLPETLDYLRQTTNQRTVPYVFFGNECIGGLCDLQQMGPDLSRRLYAIGALQ
ncbi:glutaredoxin-1 [Phalacrocorax aristotelis]|uniref:glutaredoxin-1 n=1 Tax=Phalacrocorax aristotelis TaxID=126867 RepID=UPI003F4C5A4D